MIKFLHIVLFCPILLGASTLIANYPQEVLQYPVAFAQVREDPLEEQEIIEKYFPKDKDLAILMVASGGDTAAYLAGSNLPISRIAIIDPNPSQIYLTKLKLHLLQYPEEKRLSLLGHNPMLHADRAQELDFLLTLLDIPPMALGSIDMLSILGPDYAGRYEMVFKAFREYLKPFESEVCGLFDLGSIDEQKARIAPDTSLGQAIDEAFDVVLSQENLVKIFGEKATANRVQDFSRHFAERCRVYLSNHLAAESPFFAQVFLGQFYKEIHYPWLDLPIIQPNAQIDFHQTMMDQYLQSAPKESFDLIHLSNITDWLSPEEASTTLALAYRALRPGGVVVVRQLNSNLDIYSLGKDFQWDRETATDLNGKDRSFFYRQLLIGIKPASVAPKATQMATEVLQRVPILKGKFFEALHSQQMSFEEFQRTQQQFFYAVDYYSLPMAALFSRLPDHAQRISILQNILEEHGDFDPTKYHSNTFKQFLESVDCHILENKKASSVLAFNLDLMGVSMSEDPYLAMGCFGMIEYAFADISAEIGKAVVDRGWLQEDDIIHYSLHAELDKKHAEEFFALVEAKLTDPLIKAKFLEGLELGVYIFNRLYDDLYEEAKIYTS
ncbi:MAG: hypothetical protein K1000chlam3_00608 [Chlamydiae bacterium]|nr:hypothetical protein [Chlamydiota bacterium]